MLHFNLQNYINSGKTLITLSGWLLQAQLTDTHTEQASLAFCVAKHLLGCAVLQWVGMLANELLPIGGMQHAAPLGLQQHVREQEEHLLLSFCTFWRNHLQPALPDVPPPCKTSKKDI